MTVNVLGNPAYPVELGASIFVEANHNLVEAAKRLDLNVTEADHRRPRESKDDLGVWDGDRFVYTQSGSSWWNVVRLLWQYGWSPMKAQNLVKQTVSNFLKLYNQPLFPFSSLSEAAANADLVGATGSTGAEFLQKNGISQSYAREIIQAGTRVNYGQNLPLIHGLETMVSMAAEGSVAVEGGNWQIFAGMLNLSNAFVRLNVPVTTIHRNDDGKFAIHFIGDNRLPEVSLFDDVVIAGPLQDSNITISPPFDHPPDKIPYVTLHVTLFSSPHRLSPQYFKLAGASVPEVVLTTLPPDLDLGSRCDGVGPSSFWSISILRTVNVSITPEGTSEKHYVYKIFSPKRPTAKFIAEILGVDEPQDPEHLTIGDLSKADISWFHEKTWHSYPYLYPRTTFEEISLGPNIWYTSGIESFISTMETSSLMGRNVARLMVRAWSQEFHLTAHTEGNHWEKAEL
jgi:prenylcysteine oxidase / farnesylcysteine lyase